MADPCGRTTRAGTPCKAPRVTDKDACAGHLGLGLVENPRAYQAKSAEARRDKAAARKLNSLDLIAQQLEENAAELVGAAVIAAKAGDWRAASWLYDRVHGKPVERVISSDDTDVKDLSPAERDALRARALASLGDADRDELAVRRSNAA